AEAWRQRAVDGFRAAYRKAMRGCASYPASKREVRELTAFFVLERSVQELSFELANRPYWAGIPLRAILDMMAHHAASAPSYSITVCFASAKNSQRSTTSPNAAHRTAISAAA